MRRIVFAFDLFCLGDAQNHFNNNSNSKTDDQNNNKNNNNHNNTNSLTRDIGPALLALGPLMHV
jgi:hypothetical protein